MAQNDTHVALIILTAQMWGGGGIIGGKKFSGQNLCSCAFGANIRSYTKQRARHGTPFLQPPTVLRRASMSSPPPPRRAIFRSPRGQRASIATHGTSAPPYAVGVPQHKCNNGPVQPSSLSCPTVPPPPPPHAPIPAMLSTLCNPLVGGPPRTARGCPHTVQMRACSRCVRACNWTQQPKVDSTAAGQVKTNKRQAYLVMNDSPRVSPSYEMW